MLTLNFSRGNLVFLAKDGVVEKMGRITKVSPQKVCCKLVSPTESTTSFCRESLQDKDGHQVVYAGYVPEVYLSKPEHAMLWVENRVRRSI